jgi:hypothetical protein
MKTGKRANRIFEGASEERVKLQFEGFERNVLGGD